MAKPAKKTKAPKKTERPAHKPPPSAPQAKDSGGGKFNNDNRGVLFTNDKGGNENRPDYKGSLTVKLPDGNLREYWMSGWVKQPKNGGDDFLSISINEKDAA